MSVLCLSINCHTRLGRGVSGPPYWPPPISWTQISVRGRKWTTIFNPLRLFQQPSFWCFESQNQMFMYFCFFKGQKDPWRRALICSTSIWTCGSTTNSSEWLESVTITSGLQRMAAPVTRSMNCWRTGCRGGDWKLTLTTCWRLYWLWTSGAQPKASPQRLCREATTSTQTHPERHGDCKWSKHQVLN